MRYVDIDRIDDYLSGDLSAAARAEIKEAVEIMPSFPVPLTLGDLLDQPKDWAKDQLVYGRVIAISARTGKILVDTKRCTAERFSRYRNRAVLKIWADLYATQLTYNSSYDPIIKCYISDAEGE